MGYKRKLEDYGSGHYASITSNDPLKSGAWLQPNHILYLSPSTYMTYHGISLFLPITYIIF